MKVGHRRFKVKYRDLKKNLYGDTCRHNDIIRINLRQSPDNMRDTLLHEVLHATWDVAGLRQHTTDKQEELIIGTLTPTLL